MNKRRKLLSDLKKIAAHFRLSLSKIEIVKQTAIALDIQNNKLIVMDESHHSYFKTIDLNKVGGCSLKVAYRSINAGELREKHIDEFVENIQLQLLHIDPKMSVDIDFYVKKKNTVNELREIILKARNWRDKITSLLPSNQLIRA